MGDLWRSYRSARGETRDALPDYEKWDVVPLREDGDFAIGRAVGRRGIIHHNPFSGNPHTLVSGSTGGGKTRTLARWAMTPVLFNRYLGGDWGSTIVLDPKGGAGYAAARALGAQIITEMTEIRDVLEWAFQTSEDRNALMGKLVVPIRDSSGIWREGKPEKFSEVSAEDRDKYDFRPTLIVIDEGTDILGKEDEKRPDGSTPQGKARRHLNDLVQKGRSAGIPVAMGLVRPDAAIIGGSARAQLQARVAVGAMDDAGYGMMFGKSEGEKAAQENDSMTPGQAWVVGVDGIRVATRAYIGDCDLSQYLPEALPPDLPEEVKEEIRIERARRLGVTTDPEPAEATADEWEREEFPADLSRASLDTIARAGWQWLTDRGIPSTRREIAEGIGAKTKTLENLTAPGAHERHRSLFVRAGKGPHGAVLFTASGTPPRRRTPRRGDFSGGVRGEGDGGGSGEGAERSAWWERGQDLRALVTGPFVRAGLRVFALRLAFGRAQGEAFRDPRLVWAVQDASSGRCRLCGARAPLNVHHIRDLWAGGKDEPGNLIELCQRAGKPSCHGAYTTVSGRVREFRKRIGTYGDESAPEPLAKVWQRVVGQVPTFYWPLGFALLAGLVTHRWVAHSLVAVFLLGPVWAFGYKEAVKRGYVPRPDYGVDPAQHRQPWFERAKAALSPRAFWARYTLKHYRIVSRRTFGRLFLLRFFANYLVTANLMLLLGLVPAVLALAWALV